MTVDEIAKAAGMTSPEVNSLSWLTTWDDVPFSKVRAFSEACGVVLTSREIYRIQAAYIRRDPSFKYLKKSPDWLTVYKPMIVAYVSSR